jgi:hypothetical protein
MMAHARTSALTSVLALAWGITRVAGAQPRPIPPGNEQLAAKMLGQGGSLPAGCELTRATIDHTFVLGLYRCAGKAARLELHARSDDTGAVATTREFALVPKNEVPKELVDAVQQRIAAEEKSWKWGSTYRVGAAQDSTPTTPFERRPPAPPTAGRRPWLAIGFLVVLILGTIAATWTIVARLRRQRAAR